jgi:hypothetical protein
MCIADVRTQQNSFGHDSKWGTIGLNDFGVAYWRGQSSTFQDCGNERETLTPRVMGVASAMFDAKGNIVDDVTSEMRLYLVDMAEADKIFKQQKNFVGYRALSGLLTKKFVGGFYSGDVAKREIYATNFGNGFPAAANAFGGSKWSYGIVCLWQAPITLEVDGMFLTDWGFEKTTGPLA